MGWGQDGVGAGSPTWGRRGRALGPSVKFHVSASHRAKGLAVSGSALPLGPSPLTRASFQFPGIKISGRKRRENRRRHSPSKLSVL